MIAVSKTEKALLWGIKGSIFLVAFIPLYISPSLFFPYISGKNFAFRILVEFAAALWVALMAANKEYRLRNSHISLSILLFVFVVGLADLFGVSPYNSFWSDYERMEGFITILHLALYFVIVRTVFRSRKEWGTLFGLFVLVSCLVSAFALLVDPFTQETSFFEAEYGQRRYGTLGNPPFLAAYLLMTVFLCVLRLFQVSKPSRKIFYSSAIVINCITIYLSASRGAILAGVMGALFLGIFYGLVKKGAVHKGVIKKLTAALVIILVVSTAIFLISRDSEFVQKDPTLSRFANMLSDPSASTRFRTWRLAWEGVKEHPVLGWGQENFKALYALKDIKMSEDDRWVDRAHNIVLEWLVNAGILGLLSYLLMFLMVFYALREALRKELVHRWECLIIATLLAVYFMQNLFTFDTISTYSLFFTLLAYIDNISGHTDEKSDADGTGLNRFKPVYTVPALLVVFLLAAYHLNYKPIKESQMTIRLVDSSKDLSYTEMLESYNEVLSLGTFGDSTVRHGMKKISRNILNYGLSAEEGAVEFIAATVGELEKEMVFSGHNLQFVKGVIDFYRLVAVHQPSFAPRVEALIQKGLEVNPRYYWFYLALSDLYIMQKDYTKALLNADKASAKEPDNDIILLKKAIAAIYASDGNKFMESFKRIIHTREAMGKTSSMEDLSYFTIDELYRIARAYIDVGNYDEAITYYDKILFHLYSEDKPARRSEARFHNPETRARVHFELANLFLLMENRGEALKEARKAAEVSPELYGKEAERFIYTLNN